MKDFAIKDVVGNLKMPYALRCVSFSIAGESNGHCGFQSWRDVERGDDEMHSFMRCALEFAESCGMNKANVDVSGAGTGRVASGYGLMPMAIFAQHDSNGDGGVVSNIYIVSRTKVITPCVPYYLYRSVIAAGFEASRDSKGTLMRNYYVVKKAKK